MQIVDLTHLRICCEHCNLAEICLPRGLDPKDMERLDKIARRGPPLHKGDHLFRRGDPLGSLYAVRSGSVKVSAITDQGDEQILGFYLPGELLGLDAIEHGRHSCAAVALETSSVCGFPYSQLNAICKDIPALHEQMNRLMGREISQENELLLTISRKNAEERIATFLLSLSMRFQRLGYSATKFRLSMSRGEIGNYLGLTIETVSRVFTRFRQSGLISAGRRFVEVTDMDGLKRICTGPNDSSLRGGQVA